MARSRAYKVLVFTFLGSLTISAYLFLVPVSDWFIDDFLPKLPIGQHLRHPLLISVDSELTTSTRHQFHPEYISAYQTTPVLKLVGVGQELNTGNYKGDNVIEVGIFPKDRHRIFRADSTADFYYESPSLLVLHQDRVLGC